MVTGSLESRPATAIASTVAAPQTASATNSKRSYTAAHRTLPFGTQVEVINKRNKRSVIVRINDRGPYVKGRVLDLSDVAAREIGFHRAGLAYVSAGWWKLRLDESFFGRQILGRRQQSAKSGR